MGKYLPRYCKICLLLVSICTMLDINANDLLTPFEVLSFYLVGLSIYVCMTIIALKLLTGTCCDTLLRGRKCCVSLLLAVPLLHEFSQFFHLYCLFDLYDYLLVISILWQLYVPHKFNCKMFTCVLNLS